MSKVDEFPSCWASETADVSDAAAAYDVQFLDFFWISGNFPVSSVLRNYSKFTASLLHCGVDVARFPIVALI